jgi:predicted tellurium resistance membrane protein TerC
VIKVLSIAGAVVVWIITVWLVFLGVTLVVETAHHQVAHVGTGYVPLPIVASTVGSALIAALYGTWAAAQK